MQAVLYVRPLLQLRTIRAYRELAYSICCYAVVAVVVLAATASSANLTAGREDSSEHVPAVDGRLYITSTHRPSLLFELRCRDLFCCHYELPQDLSIIGCHRSIPF